MRLAHPRRSQEQEVALLLHEPQSRELGDDGSIDGGLEVELEVLKTLVEREVSEVKAAMEAAGGCGRDFGGQEPFENLDRGGLLVLGPLELGGELLGCGRKTEIGKMLAQAGVGSVEASFGGGSHRASSA
jgi:hypothetical protein